MMVTENAMAIVKAARSDSKITANEIIKEVFSDFIEFHGDRKGTDDSAILGGLAIFSSTPVTVIATNRGETVSEHLSTHFGCPTPGGYRKALRLAKQAAKFNRPIVFLVNTPGAYPGKTAEEQGQGSAIAQNIIQISQLPVPIITIIYGEGGSGGALALACGDQVWMLENSTYSILSPEGFASILWKDGSRTEEAAELMQMTPQALLRHKVIEGIISESKDHKVTCRAIANVLAKQLQELGKLSAADLLIQRKERYRKF